MNKVNLVSLSGDPQQYSLDEDAYELLYHYLERSRVRLREDPDKDEVLRDLERSIGEKFANLLRAGQRMLTGPDVEAALAQVGTVETGTAEPPFASPHSPPRRRLYRLREGQRIAGVCTGLAAYADIDVALVRTILVLLAVFTGGFFVLIYVAAMFILPIAQMPEEYEAAHGVRFKLR